MRCVPALACLTYALLATGCSTLTPTYEEATPLVGPAPRLNTTPMATALACMRAQGQRDLRIGVSDFVDGTGVMEGGTQNSRALSQRPDMMMVVALAASGAQLVNRSSVNVAEWELNKAMEKKLGDGRPTLVDNQRVPFRPIRAGVLLGSTHYVTGAITELNWNIESGVAEAGAFSASIGKRTYRISIAIDVVVTNTQTTEIVHARSYKKQLVGYETNANLFRFVNHDSVLKVAALGNASAAAATKALELFQANLGEKQNEPTQTALRWAIDLAAYDIMRNLRRSGSACDSLLPPETFDDGVLPPDAAVGGAQASYKAPQRQASRSDPDKSGAYVAVLNDAPADAAASGDLAAARPLGAFAPAAQEPRPAPKAIAAADDAPAPRRAPLGVATQTPAPAQAARPAPQARRASPQLRRTEAGDASRVAAQASAPSEAEGRPHSARVALAPTPGLVGGEPQAAARATPADAGPRPRRWMNGGVSAPGPGLSQGSWTGAVE